MSILDKLRRKKKEEKIPEKKEVLEERVEKPPKDPALFPKRAGPTGQAKAKKITKRKTALAYKVLKSLYITEKSTELARQGQYTFKVFKDANKVEIKKAIEGLYGVNVEGVRIIKKPSKIRRRGRQEGRKPGFKKAVVKIKEGQKIDVFPS